MYSTTLNRLIHSTLQCMERRRMQMFHLTSRTIQTVPLGTFRLSIHYCQGMQSINQSIIQSINQPTSQSINQSINIRLFDGNEYRNSHRRNWNLHGLKCKRPEFQTSAKQFYKIIEIG